METKRERISLYKITKEEYEELKRTGLFWVWFPTATGTYHLDILDRGIPEYIKK